MIKLLPCRFNSVWDSLACLLSKGVLKWGFLCICVTSFFAVCIFGNFGNYISYEGHPSFRSDHNLKNVRKWSNNWDKVFCFLGHWIWISCGKFSLLQTEYLSSAISVLTNSPKTSHITKRDILQLNFPYSDKEYQKKAVVLISALFGTLYHADSRRVFWKRSFRNIYLITSLAVRNLRNTSAMMIILILEI